MNIIDKAKALRNQIEELAINLDDEKALDFPELFPNWSNNKHYEAGDRVRFGSLLFKCLQAHDAQDDWTPEAAVSLWVRIDNPQEEFPEWRQPTGAHDAYNKGDKVSYKGRHWVSLIDNNVWNPMTSFWEEVVEEVR